METLPTDGGGGGGSGRVSGLSNTQMSSGQRFGNGYATITLVEQKMKDFAINKI